MCACLKEHMGEVIEYVFCVLSMVCPGTAVSWNRQDCNRQKHATSAKHLVNWDWSVFKPSDTSVVFKRVIFLILVVKNNKTSSGIDGKTSNCLSRISLHYRYLELRFC